MKLQSMDIKNFRCFEKLHIEFDERLTVLVGANGAGKTAIVDAVTYFLHQYAARFLEKSDHQDIQVSDIRIGSNYSHINCKIASDDSSQSKSFDVSITSEETNSKDSTDSEQEDKQVEKPCKLRSVVVRYTATRTLDKFERGPNGNITSESAFQNSFSPSIDFSNTLTWFVERLTQEALEARKRKDMNFSLPDLVALRRAVSAALGDYNEPYMTNTPLELFITRKEEPDKPLNLKQLSDGYRTMLALIMDLSRRMAVANADAEWPEGQTVLHSPGIVLIDEVEQHLHPAWQQTVLPRLMEIFPNVQFIVTTHSPQVLTSVEAKHIRVLGGGDVVYAAPRGTWGAEASRLLERVFGVDSRPPSRATDELNRYADLVYADQWDGDEARRLRDALDERYGGEEPFLARLDLYIANRRWELAETAGEQA